VSNTTRVLVVSAIEFDTIMAALRLYEDMSGRGFIESADHKDILAIATHNGEHGGLSTNQVGVLCDYVSQAGSSIWTGNYEHRHGNDLSVYATEEAAQAGRDRVAEEQWENEGVPLPKPETDIGDAYFDYMERRERGEWFHIEKHEMSR
jgi:hypothetical protein